MSGPKQRAARACGRSGLQPGEHGAHAAVCLGVLADPEFGECEVRLESGDALLVYTDGVIELRTTEWEYGERRLLEVASEYADRSADEIVDAVLRMAVEAQDGEPRDDIALLCLKQR